MKFTMDTALKMTEMEAKAILQEEGLPPTVGRDDFIRVRDSGDRLLRTAFDLIIDCHHLRHRIDQGEAEAAAELAWSIGAAVSNMRILHAVPEYRDQRRRDTLPTDMGVVFAETVYFSRVHSTEAMILHKDEQRRRAEGRHNGGKARQGKQKPITRLIHLLMDRMFVPSAENVLLEFEADATDQENMVHDLRESEHTDIQITHADADGFKYVNGDGRRDRMSIGTLRNRISDAQKPRR